MHLHVTCTECKTQHDIKVNANDYTRWQNGTLIQIAFPYLTPGERELLISKICETCFDKMFAE